MTSPDEQRIIDSLRGGSLDLRPSNLESADGKEGQNWHEPRQAPARLVQEALTTDQNISPLTVTGVRITGKLDVKGKEVHRLVHFDGCYFDQDVVFSDTFARTIKFTDCSMRSLTATSLVSAGNFILDKSIVRKGTSFLAGRIEGSMTCLGTKFLSGVGYALNLQSLRVAGSLWCSSNVVIDGGMLIRGGDIAGDLDLSGAQVVHINGIAIDAENLRVNGSIYLSDGFESKGPISLRGVRIGRNLVAVKCALTNVGGVALDASLSEVGDSVLLGSRFRAVGSVSFRDARVGDLNGARAHFTHDSVSALDLSGIQSDRQVNLSGCRIIGGLQFSGARIGGDLVLSGSEHQQHQQLHAVIGLDSRIAGSIYMTNGLKSNGGFDLTRIRVEGDVRCEGSQISQHLRPSFLLDSSDIQGVLELSGAELEGQLRLVSACVGRVAAERVSVSAPSRTAILAAGLTTRGVFSANSARISGEVYFNDAVLGGSLELANSEIRGPVEGTAICADRLHTSGKIALNSANVTGSLNLHSAQIDGILSFEHAEVNCSAQRGGTEHVAVTLRHAVVKQSVYASFSSIKGGIDLIDAHVGAWRDRKESWPEELALDGFTYKAITAAPQVSVRDRIDWCKKNATIGLNAQQPLAQLARFYREAGDDRAARLVGIEKEYLRRRRQGRSAMQVVATFWSSLLRVFVGYGYRPWLILWPFSFLLAAGSLAFTVLDTVGLIKPSSGSPAGLTFNAFRFTADHLFPVANFKQRDSFVALGIGEWLVFVFTFSGWFLAFVLVAAISGVFKRE